MNELIRIELGVVKADSRMIADHFGKEHAHVMRDIRDEIEKLRIAGEDGLSIFGESSYINQQKKQMPCYIMNEEGIMQIAARYDAVARRKLILLIKELKEKNAPKSPAEMLLLSAQQLVEHEKRLNQFSHQIESIKETIIYEPNNWREEINRMFNKVAYAIGQDKFRAVRTESYKLLDSRARTDLERRLINYKKRLTEQGISKSKVDAANKLDVIEADPKLREIYSQIIKEYTIKYCC